MVKRIEDASMEAVVAIAKAEDLVVCLLDCKEITSCDIKISASISLVERIAKTFRFLREAKNDINGLVKHHREALEELHKE